MDKLPESVLVHVLCWLKVPDCINCTLINKDLQTLTQSGKIWMLYYLSHNNPYFQTMVTKKLIEDWYNFIKIDNHCRQRLLSNYDIKKHEFKINIWHQGASFVASDGCILVAIDTCIKIYFIYRHIYFYKLLPLPSWKNNDFPSPPSTSTSPSTSPSIPSIRGIHYDKGMLVIQYTPTRTSHWTLHDGSYRASTQGDNDETHIKHPERLGDIVVIDIHTEHQRHINLTKYFRTTTRGTSIDIQCIALNYPLCIFSKKTCFPLKLLGHEYAVFNLQDETFSQVSWSNDVGESLLQVSGKIWIPCDSVGFVDNEIWFKYNQHLYSHNIYKNKVAIIGYVIWMNMNNDDTKDYSKYSEKPPVLPRMARKIRLFQKRTISGLITIKNRQKLHYLQCINGILTEMSSTTSNVQYHCRYDGIVRVHFNKYYNVINISI